jgi:hypothetical protein
VEAENGATERRRQSVANVASSENANSSVASREEGDWKKAKNGAIIKAKKEVKLTPLIK